MINYSGFFEYHDFGLANIYRYPIFCAPIQVVGYKLIRHSLQFFIFAIFCIIYLSTCHSLGYRIIFAKVTLQIVFAYILSQDNIYPA